MTPGPDPQTLPAASAERIEEELRESEARFRRLSDATSEGIAVSEHGRLLEVNKAFADMFGYSPSEMVGMSVLDLVAPGSRDEVVERILTGSEEAYEAVCMRRDGSLFPVEATGKAIPFFGRVARVARIRDITERKRADEAIRRRGAIVEAVAFAAERFLRSRTWSEGIQGILGRLGHATGVSRVYVYENHHADDGALVHSLRYEWSAPGITPQIDNPVNQDNGWGPGWEWWVETLASGGIHHGNTRTFPDPVRPSLEEEDIVSIAIVPVFVGDVWWGSIGFDECVTEREWTAGEIDALRAAAGILGAAIGRERVERELTEAQAKYRTLVEQIPAIVYLAEFGAEGNWLYISPQIEQILGYTVEEWLSHPHPFASHVHPDDLKRVMADEIEGSEAGDVIRTEYRMRARDDRWLWIVDESTVVRDADGNRLFMQGLMYDATERKHLEEERRRLLGRVVVAQEEERQRIASDIHDDQVQKMTAVGLRLHRLAQHLDGEDLAYLQELERSVELSIERLRHLLFELRPPMLDRDGLHAALDQYLRRSEAESGIEHHLQVALEGELPVEIRAAAYRIAQEALTNVRKHSEATRVDVTLEGRDGGVLVRVRDDGKGFRPGPEPQPGHLGLLAMRERAELTGGWCHARSAPGVGTTVEFWLPAEPEGS